jgi:DnaJ-class molecular chaperone
MAFRCVDCDRVWRSIKEAEECCPHVEDIGDTSTEECPACGGTGGGEKPDRDSSECERCGGSGLAYKQQAIGMKPGWTTE